MKKNKKIIMGIVAAVIAAIVGIGAFFIIRGRSGEKVKVYSVSDLNNADWFGEEGEEQTGVVSSDYIDEVKLDSSMEVQKIYVKKGDKVKKGQKLLKYNAEEDELNLKLEKLQIESAESKIKKMEEQLARLKKGDTKAMDDDDDSDSTTNKTNKNSTKSTEDDGDDDPDAKLEDNPFVKMAQAFSLTASAAEQSTARAILVAAGGDNGNTDPNGDSEGKEDTKVAKPTAKEGLVYDGTEQTGVEGVQEGYTLSGPDKATNAGTYEVTATLKDGYVWEDGSKDAYRFSYVIGKKPVDIPKTTADSFTYNGKDQTCIAEDTQGIYTISGNVERKAGEHIAIATLKKETDPSGKSFYNYVWKDENGNLDESESVSISYIIQKAAPLTAVYKGGEISEGDKIPTVVEVTGFVEGETQKNAPEFDLPIVDTSSVSGPGTYTLTPTKGVADNYAGFNYTSGTLLVNNKSVDNILTLTKYNAIVNEVSGSNSGDTPYIINVVTDGKAGSAKIKGDVINNIISKGHYVIIREYTSKDLGLSNIFVVSPKVSAAVTKTGVYTVNNLLGIIKAGSLNLKGKTKVNKGEIYTYKAYLAGVNVTSYSSWKLTGNKSKSTTVSRGSVAVYKSETAKKLTLKATFNGLSDSATLRVSKAKATTATKTSTKTTKKNTSTRKSTTKAKKTNGSGSGSGSGSGGGSSDLNYTKDELQQAITEKEADIAEAKTDLVQLKIDYKEHKATVDKALVRAKISGTVTYACTLSTLPEDGEPAIIVKASNGMYVKTTVNEMNLSSVTVGGVLHCRSLESDQKIDAVVTEVSDFPVGGDSGDGTTNPNSSRYPVVAYIENAEGLHNGDTVYISYNEQDMGTVDEDAIFVNKAYVLSEGKQYYVYKRGKNKKLKRQNVQIGETAYGEYMQITSGITNDDYLAFPYGKSVKEGAGTKISTNMDEIIY